MTENYEFKLDLDNWHQVDDTRFFEIEASPEQVEKFIEDKRLFKGEADENS